MRRAVVIVVPRTLRQNRFDNRNPVEPSMLPAAASLLTIALFAAVFGYGGLADGPLGALQVATVVAAGAGLATLLLRIAGR